MLEIITSVIVVLYFLIVCTVLAGLFKKSTINETFQPFVSVIIPARNEEGNIANCLDSLVQQEYPTDRYEIIVVDDDSTDLTAKIVAEIAEKNKVVKLISPDNSINLPPGKARALAAGILHSKSELIFNTDADCLFSGKWISGLVEHYSENAEMVNGVTLPEGNGIFHGIQTLDFSYLHAIVAGFTSLGIPLAGMGNNMSYTRKAYQKSRGFESMPFSLTEDFALTRAMIKKGSKIKHIVSQETVVSTAPLDTLSELYNQKKRWAVGGIGSGPVFYILFIIAWTSVVGLINLFFFNTMLTGILLGMKAGADFTLIFALLKKVRRQTYTRYFLHFELYLALYILIFPIILLITKKVEWKGRIYP